jgi:alpha-beta hydrolase superfamily lysophospholipase
VLAALDNIQTRYAPHVNLRQDQSKKGIRERVGSIVGSVDTIPMALWTPLENTPSALVLVGHGASGTKLEEYVVALARRLVRDFDMAVCAIDGPVHGDRRSDGEAGVAMQFLDFAQLWGNDPDVTDAMVRDWRETIDAMFSEGVVSTGTPVGYWGLSMGTILGLPLVAAEPRIEAAVLGLMGIAGPTKARIATDAASIDVPVMFLMQWDDELFSRERGLDLFTHLGTRDKTLIATPGAHAEVTPETFRRTGEFLADRLKVRQKSSTSIAR